MKKRKMLNKVIAGIIIFAAISALFSDILLVRAATPKVMVSDYSTNKDKVMVGENFELTIVLTNTSKNKIKNLKLTLASDNGEILPVQGTGSVYVESMDGQSDSSYTFKLCTAGGIEEKNYKINIRMEYEDTNGNPYDMEDNIYIPVYQTRRMSITDVQSDDVKVGEDIEISGRINNLGDGKLYNVTASLSGKYTREQTAYIGNIEPGKGADMSIIAKTTAASETAEGSKETLTISYEDKIGNTYSRDVDINFYIDTVSYENLEVIKENTAGNTNTKKIVCCFGILMILILSVVVRVVLLKKKKKHLEEI